MGNILKTLKTGIKSQKIASFDVETKNRDNDFYIVGLYHDKEYHYFYDIDKFHEYLRVRLKGYWLVATNLSFDLTSSLYGTKYWNDLTIISNGGYMLMASDKKNNLRFIDTLNYHKASVEQLGEIVGKEKLPHPHFLGEREPQTQQEEEQLIEYNKRDCEISHDFLVWFQDVINNLGGDLKITIASTTMDIWRRKYNKNTILKEDYIFEKKGIKNNLKDKIFEAYYGGRTEVIQRGYFEDLEYYDFNSLYPSVMLNDLPHPNSVKYDPKGSIKHIMTREGVSYVDIEHITDELPLLPFRKDRLLFPSGRFKGWYSHVELREAITNGYIIHNVYETISYTRKFSPFYEYVTSLYDMRTESKKNRSSEQLIYKLLMNSLYGKFGERWHHEVKYFDLRFMDHDQEKDLDSIEKDNLTLNSDGSGYYTIKGICNSCHVLPIIPVYITAMARIKLWRKARTLDPVYMDTDSIVTREKIPSSKELGELEHEHHIDHGIFIRPKLYYFRDGDKDIVRAKGIPHCSKEQFFSIIDKKDIDYLKFVKLKEGIKRGLKINSVIRTVKHIDIEDNKRLWDHKFSLEAQRSREVVIDEIHRDKKENIRSIPIKVCVSDTRCHDSTV